MVITCFLLEVRIHYEPTQQQSTMVAMVMSCDIINSCCDMNLECLPDMADIVENSITRVLP